MILSGKDYKDMVEAIDAIYVFPDKGAMFHALCDKLRKIIGIYSAIFVPVDPGTGTFLFSGYQVYGNSEGALLTYLACYAPQDPYITSGWFRDHPNEVAQNTDLTPKLIRSEFAQDFLIPVANVFHVIGSTLGTQGDITGIFAVHRQRHERRFSERDKQILNILAPHISRSIHARDLMSSRLHEKSCGVILVNESSVPLYMNADARQALNGVPAASLPDPGFGCAPAFFERGGRRYRIRTVPIDGARKKRGKFILMEPHPPVRKLAAGLANHGLSRREQEVATLVVQGHSNREIAERLYISEMTVKDHLKSIFGKLEIRRRGELAALAMGHTRLLQTQSQT